MSTTLEIVFPRRRGIGCLSNIESWWGNFLLSLLITEGGYVDTKRSHSGCIVVSLGVGVCSWLCWIFIGRIYLGVGRVHLECRVYDWG